MTMISASAASAFPGGPGSIGRILLLASLAQASCTLTASDFAPALVTAGDGGPAGAADAGSDAGQGSPSPGLGQPNSSGGLTGPADPGIEAELGRDQNQWLPVDGGSAGGSTSTLGVDATSEAIVGSYPADGERGVLPDVVLSIDFGRAMDTSTVPGALSSDDLPLDRASLAWNTEETVLRVTLPEPLALASGDDPARCYSYRISEDAADTSRRPVLPARIGFCTARRVAQTLAPIRDAALTGNFRSDGTYGDGACGPGAQSICVGDSGFAANAAYRGFLTFDSSVLKDAKAVLAAELRIELEPAAGRPFEALGALWLEQVRFEGIDATAFGATHVGASGAMQPADADSALLADVTPALRVPAGSGVQFRLRFELGTNGDGRSDHIRALNEAVGVRVDYLIP